MTAWRRIMYSLTTEPLIRVIPPPRLFTRGVAPPSGLKVVIFIQIFLFSPSRPKGPKMAKNRSETTLMSKPLKWYLKLFTQMSKKSSFTTVKQPQVHFGPHLPYASARLYRHGGSLASSSSTWPAPCVVYVKVESE